MSAKYYYLEDNKQLGPFTIEELKSANLNSETYIWEETMTEWQKIKDLPIIAEQLKVVKMPPTPPDVSKTEVSGHLKITTQRSKTFFLLSPTRKEWFIIVAWCSFNVLALFLSEFSFFNEAHKGGGIYYFYPFVPFIGNCQDTYREILFDRDKVIAEKEKIKKNIWREHPNAKIFSDTTSSGNYSWKTTFSKGELYKKGLRITYEYEVKEQYQHITHEANQKSEQLRIALNIPKEAYSAYALYNGLRQMRAEGFALGQNDDIEGYKQYGDYIWYEGNGYKKWDMAKIREIEKKIELSERTVQKQGEETIIPLSNIEKNGTSCNFFGLLLCYDYSEFFIYVFGFFVLFSLYKIAKK